MSKHVFMITSVIGLGTCDARFCTLILKIAHYFHVECAIFTSIILE